MPFRYDVFLSHSSADKPAVEFLARKLEAAGITPFLDKWNLIPGEPWQEALEEALDESRTCAVFIGPEGVGPWENEEMRSALEDRVKDKSRRVIPVLLPGSQDFHKEKLPRFIRRLTWVDFRSGLEDEDVFHRLVGGIRGTAPGSRGDGGGPVKPPRPQPYRSMAQPPEEFIDRREYDLVLRALCPEAGTVKSGTSVGITTALRGAGGFGKTALAQKLCQDKRVQEAYPDGILWTTMGEDVDANGRLSRIRDLIRWWIREESPAFETAAAAGAMLRELLAKSRFLIVIDDVWNSADVTPFQGMGKGSALLITTRDSQTLPSDSKRIAVDGMASIEAVELLRSGLPHGEEQGFLSLASRLGEWPLLLKMVNRQIRELVNDERRSVQDALKEINEALNSEGFAAFDRDDPESRHAAASRTIMVSVQRLQEKERERYFQLAVFPEDLPMPVSVLERLWRLGIFSTRKLCRRLHDLSLLQEFNPDAETVRIHDVLRQVLLEQIGDHLPDLHRQLLDEFWPTKVSWSDLPIEEKYLWRNLAFHLLGAKRKDELRRLLTDLSFIQAKLNATDVNALIADFQIFIEEERELRLIRDALRLSGHVLARDHQQLASQLFGRLVGIQGKGIRQLLDSAEAQLRLKPRPGSLAPPGGSLIRTLEGHLLGVSAVAVVDDRRAISGSNDGTLRVWDLETGETLRILGHVGWVYAVAVVDGRRAISGSDDGGLQVCDLETGETLHLEGHWDRVNAVAVVDTRQVVSGSDDGSLRVWDLKTGETLRILEGHSGGVNAVAVVDGRRAISGSNDRTLRVWDLETGDTLRILEGHSGRVTVVALVDGRRAVSSSTDRMLRVWDLETGEALRTFQGHCAEVSAVAVLDGRWVVSGSADWTLQVWDLETDETFRTLEGHLGRVSAVAVLGDRRVVSGSADRTLRVWDLETDETFRTLEGHLGAVSAVAVVDSHRAISGSDDQILRMWDMKTGEPLRILQGHWGGVTAVAVVDSRRAVSGSSDRMLRVWDLETGNTLRILKGHWGEIKVVAVVDGRRVVSASTDERVRVWDLETGETLRTLQDRFGAVSVLTVVDIHRAIYASPTRMLQILDLKTGETLQSLQGHSGWVTTVAVVDGRRAISGSSDGTLRVWDLETGETLRTLTSQSGMINAVAVVDSHRVVSSSSDRTLRVWDLETGETLAMVTLEAQVWAVAVSPDGRILVAGDQAGKVHFLDWMEPE